MELADRPTVIHVVERPKDASAEFDRAIAQAGCRAERVETVYGALARLVRPEDRPALAVIVCVDALAGPELEFFVLAAQRCPDVPVYVYGCTESGDRRQRACAIGAQSDVSAEHIATVLTELGRVRSGETAPEPQPAPPMPVTVEEAPAEETPEPATEEEPTTVAEDATPAAPTTPAADRSGVGVPTPWQPAAGRPQRIPPGAKAGAGRRTPDEPLLTRQEVDALLSRPPSADKPGKASDDGPDE